MPCYVTGSAVGDAELAASEASREATEATRIACETLTLLEKLGKLSQLTRNTQRWWSNHKKVDAQRKAVEKEQVRVARLAIAARDKLTPDEKSALGLREG